MRLKRRSSVSVLVIWLWCAPALLFATSASAQGLCVTLPGYAGMTTEHTKYAVHLPSFSELDVGAVPATIATVIGADLWNEQANARSFEFAGFTTLTDIDPENCENIDYSIVWVDWTNTACGDANACVHSRCGGRLFRITIYGRGLWAVGEPTFTEGADLAGLMAHEFGHTLGLDHPERGVYAVMGSGRENRDLYQWDIQCAEQLAGHRDLQAFRRLHMAGTLQDEEALDESWEISKLAAGVTRHAGSWNWSFAIHDSDCPAWAFGTSDAECIGESEMPGVGMTPALWHGTPSVDRVLFPSRFEHPQYGRGANHMGRIRWSSDGFATSEDAWLRHCTGMNGWMTCNEDTHLRTARNVAVAWDNINEQTVFAWAHQNRTHSDDRELYITVGHVDDALLPAPFGYGVRVSAGPGIACNAFLGNCIVAFADQNDPYSVIRTRRFWNIQGSRQYIPFPGATNEVNVANAQTAGRIAVWVHGEKYFMAFRPLAAQSTLLVLESSDGVSWDIHRSIHPGSVTGPSAVSYWEGLNNALVYAR